MGPRLYAYEGLPEPWRGRGQAVPSDLKRCAEAEMEEETVLSCLPKLNRDLISQDWWSWLIRRFSRQAYWSGLPFPSPGDLPDSGLKRAPPVSAALAGRFFTTVPPGKPHTEKLLVIKLENDHGYLAFLQDTLVYLKDLLPKSPQWPQQAAWLRSKKSGGVIGPP